MNLPFFLIFDDSSSPFQDSTFLQKLFPNFWDFLVQFLAFIVLLLIVYFLGYKRIKKLIKARKDYVEHNLRDSEDQKAIAERNAKLSAQNIDASKQQAAAIITSAKAQADKEAAAIVAKAKEDAILEKQKADQDIAAAKKKSQDEIHQQIVEVAISASSQVLGREVDSKDNARLVSDFVKDLDEKGARK
ncbi:MAG: ATP synthase subunit b [Tenericutes bacterium ADurb.BinA155]|nr:MAG: ATP synthase subunit b [Tenericutes bacterium ADurb.BinA155]